MDLWKYINELYEEKRRLDKLIESLEEHQSRQGSPAATRNRRGRKPGMPEAERRLVSDRMKRYWAERRAAEATPPDEAKTRAAGGSST